MGRKETDPVVRGRIAAWTAHLMKTHGYDTPAAMARKMGVTRPAVATILDGTRTAGLDYVVKLHRTFHIQTDVLIDEDPPQGTQGRPFYASSQAAEPKRQNH